MAGEPRVSPFETIRETDEEGNEHWSARDLAKVLGYTEWRNFTRAIKKAMEACENSGHATSDHFVAVNKMVTLGSGAERKVQDFHLSRYVCYLVIQNADPEKEIVALGQTYFAVQTRRAEAEMADELTGLTEDQRRLYTRAQLAEHNRELALAANAAGVVTARDFAIFHDSGYRGLYNGETSRDIATRKGLARGQALLDHMGFEELSANLFRAAQAEAKLRREGTQGKDAANQTHFQVGAAVRRFIVEDLGGTAPEDLPTPKESSQQVQRREQRRLEAERQPSFFADDEGDSNNASGANESDS